MTIDLGRLDRSVLAAEAKPETEPRDHFVELYEDEASFIESVRTFLTIGIIKGDAAVVIADTSHREKLEAALAHSVDLESARTRGLLTSLDAKQTLAAFMQDGLPDPAKFDQKLGKVLERAAAKAHKVRIFGEMVAVLWKQGNVDGALALEDLWNRLSDKHDFRLFCGYPTSAFDAEDLPAISALAARHSAILTAQRGV